MEKMYCLSGLRELPENVLESEFRTLKDECYMDHAGAALYSSTQIDDIHKDLISNLYSNPHSSSISSKLSTDTVDQVRYRILHHFNTDVSEYSVIFTSGATASLKLVAETFNFNDTTSTSGRNSEQGCCRGTFAYLQDNHTSVLGMREIVVNRGAKLRCVQRDEAFDLMSMRNRDDAISDNLSKANSLFVFPAQCNFSGFKYPLTWIDGCHRGLLDRKYKNRNNIAASHEARWFCLLDAAALVSTSPLDLSVYKPDFICLSFYKIFGFPTGLGALVVRNCAIDTLKKSYYGGGTVLIALSSQPFHVKRPLLHERFEDGTLNFLSIVSLLHGMEAVRWLGTDMQTVSAHCYTVARYCYEKLSRLHHANNKPAVILYCDSDFSDANQQGNIVNFNVIRHNGQYVGYAEVQALTNLHRIHIRTGCFCNPGACQRHLKLTDDQLRHHFQEGHVCGDDVDLVNGQPTGSIRVSFGIYSRLHDVDKLIALIEDCFILKPVLYKERDSFSVTKFREQNGSNDKLNGVDYNWKCEKVNRQVRHVFVSVPATSLFSNKSLKVNPPPPAAGGDNDSVNDTSGIKETEARLVNDKIKLAKIFIYPVKSCAAMEIQEAGWPIESRGFKYDRQWMVVSATGVALTQKTEPLLCLINPSVCIHSGLLTLSAYGKPDCVVPISDKSDRGIVSAGDISFCQSKVCGDRVSALDCGDDVAAWLSDVLSTSGVRLVMQCLDDLRTTREFLNNRRKAKLTGSLSSSTPEEQALSLLSLSNQAQFLLINMSTVSWLAEQLPPNGDCDKEKLLYRFRSNFVISGSVKPFAEQSWTKIEIAGKLFKVVGPCRRCQMICIDQFTGVRTKEPLTTLAAALDGKLQFGIYLQQIVNSDSDYNYNIDETTDCENHFVHVGDEVKCYE